MDLAKGKERAKDLFKKLMEALKTFPATLRAVYAFLSGKIKSIAPQLLQSVAQRAAGLSPKSFGGFSRIRVLGGLALLFLILLISALLINSRGTRERNPVNVSAGHGIPVEELFIPDEPDFLPEFLLEREPRPSWSIEDIRPYWRRPADPASWQGVIRSAVDELMEGVP